MRHIKLALAVASSFCFLGSAPAQTGHANSTPAFSRNYRSLPAPVNPQPNIARPAPGPQYAPPLRGQMTVVPQGDYYNPAYAQSEKRQHLGTDDTAASGTPVYAAATGRVQRNTTSLSNPYNSQVTVQQPGGRQVVYGHVYSTSTTGQVVQQGQYIGYVQPANSSQPGYNPHLHLGVNTQGNAGQSGWGRAPVTMTQQQAQQSGWEDANGIYRAPQR
jgi:murein DD-endopeptidase MepM/ murein hydrolase activator NlpD